MDNLQKDIIQTISGEADSSVSLQGEDASWSNEQNGHPEHLPSAWPLTRMTA